MEEEVTVQIRKQDEGMLASVIEQAKDEYAKATQRTVKVNIDPTTNLPSTGYGNIMANPCMNDPFDPYISAGGLIMTGLFGRIVCNNTLETRMELLSEMVCWSPLLESMKLIAPLVRCYPIFAFCSLAHQRIVASTTKIIWGDSHD